MKIIPKQFPQTHPQGGVALLIALLLMGVLLGISTSLLNVTLKQYQLAGVAYASEAAFQAANAGMECALYYDHLEPDGAFDVKGDGTEQGSKPSIACMGGALTGSHTYPNTPGGPDNPSGYPGNGDDGLATSGEEQYFQFDWGDASNPRCVKMSVYKYYTTVDDAGVEVTVDGEIMKISKQHCTKNSICTVIQSRGYNVACSQISTNKRVVEREYTVVY